MTVKEILDKLKEMPEDLPVTFRDSREGNVEVNDIVTSNEYYEGLGMEDEYNVNHVIVMII